MYSLTAYDAYYFYASIQNLATSVSCIGVSHCDAISLKTLEAMMFKKLYVETFLLINFGLKLSFNLKTLSLNHKTVSQLTKKMQFNCK